VGYPSLECQLAGELYLLELAQKGMKIAGVRMLATDVASEEDVIGRRRKLIVIGSRGRNQIAEVYGRAVASVAEKSPAERAIHAGCPLGRPRGHTIDTPQVAKEGVGHKRPATS
jgi:hypothetical protein